MTTPDPVIVKEGYARKRSGRMHQWSHRYFLLSQHVLPNSKLPGVNSAGKIGARLAYKVKAESVNCKASYDLLPGCVVTDVQASGIGGNNSKLIKRLYTFWIIWPVDKNSPGEKSSVEELQKTSAEEYSWNAVGEVEDDSGAEEERSRSPREQHSDGPARKDFKYILDKQGVETQRVQFCRSKAEEQLASHKAHDNSISLGLKVVAVAAGGAVRSPCCGDFRPIQRVIPL